MLSSSSLNSYRKQTDFSPKRSTLSPSVQPPPSRSPHHSRPPSRDGNDSLEAMISDLETRLSVKKSPIPKSPSISPSMSPPIKSPNVTMGQKWGHYLHNSLDDLEKELQKIRDATAIMQEKVEELEYRERVSVTIIIRCYQ